MSNLQQAIANIEIEEKRKNRLMKIKNTYTFEQAVAQEVEISFKDGKQFHEIKGEKIIEWDNPDYTENRLECRSYDIIPSNYGIKELPTKILRDADFSKFGTDDLTERIKTFLSKDKELRSFGIELVKTGFLFHGPPGCHAKGTKILMYNGLIKNVEDISVGELLMGPDSSPREVLKLARNRQQMVKIIPNKGEEFVVNLDHILHLTPSGEISIKTPINITVKDYLKQTICFQERFKLTRTGVNFSNTKELPIDSYILGIWLGDGSSDVPALTTMDDDLKNIWLNFAKENDMEVRINKQGLTNSKSKTYALTSKEKTKGKNKITSIFRELEVLFNKHIPNIYLTSSRENRLKLLAGLIDTDGHRDSNGGYSYLTVSEKLNEGVLFLARSLGYAAYSSKTLKAPYINGIKGNEAEYFNINISGDMKELPCVLERKKPLERKMNKSVLRTGFKVEMLQEDNYYGFTLDKDHLYLTSDFTIHHNTGKTHKINNTVMSLLGEKGISFKLTMSDINIGDFTDFLNYKTPPEGCDKLFVVIEDLGGGEQPDLGMRTMASQDHLLAFLDGNSIPANWRHIPIVIFSTTNYPMLFLANLIDRPGRFDDVVEVYYPSGELLVEYAEDFMKSPLPEFAKREIAKGEISIAHVKGALIRNIVYGEPVHTTIQKMRAWTEVIRKSMEKKEI